MYRCITYKQSGICNCNRQKLFTLYIPGELQGAFQRFDKDKSGFVEFGELKCLFQAIGRSASNIQRHLSQIQIRVNNIHIYYQRYIYHPFVRAKCIIVTHRL